MAEPYPLLRGPFRRAADSGSRRDLLALPTSEIESLREALALRKFEPHLYLVGREQGSRQFWLASGHGRCAGPQEEQLPVVLTLDVIMRSVAVEAGGGEIEPVKR